MDAKKDQKPYTIKEKPSEWVLKKSVALQMKWGQGCQEERLEREIQTKQNEKNHPPFADPKELKLKQ